MPSDSLKDLIKLLNDNKMKLCTAESCTGGLIAASITSIAGTSSVFERGYVTYSNQAKQSDLNVSASTIKKHGAVSKEVVLAMATGALAASQADIAISVTGIAGPDGGSKDKPVGLVYFGYAYASFNGAIKRNFDGADRNQIQTQTKDEAIKILIALINGETPK